MSRETPGFDAEDVTINSKYRETMTDKERAFHHERWTYLLSLLEEVLSENGLLEPASNISREKLKDRMGHLQDDEKIVLFRELLDKVRDDAIDEDIYKELQKYFIKLKKELGGDNISVEKRNAIEKTLKELREALRIIKKNRK